MLSLLLVTSVLSDDQEIGLGCRISSPSWINGHGGNIDDGVIHHIAEWNILSDSTAVALRLSLSVERPLVAADILADEDNIGG